MSTPVSAALPSSSRGEPELVTEHSAGLGPDVDYIAVGNDVVATLDPQQSTIARRNVAAAFDEVLPGDHLGLDEALLNLGVDLTRRLPGGRATAQRPRHRLLALVGSEKGDQPEQLVRGSH